jgi:hypothetical protein
MFLGPMAITFFAETFFGGTSGASLAEAFGVLSPFAATFSLPLDAATDNLNSVESTANAQLFFGYVGWTILYNAVLLLAMMRMFQVRWRVAD